MTDITPNHLHIYRDRRGKHITLDGQDLLLDRDDPMLITGMENQDEVTRVMLTLLAPKITVYSEIEDREPEPATVDAPAPTLAEELRQVAEEYAYPEPEQGFRALADRAEQMETEWEEELDQISADRDHWCAENARLIDNLERVRDAARDLMHEGKTAEEWMQAYEEATQDLSDARAEVERLTAELETETVALEENVAPDQQSNQKETLAGALPNPADVPEGQAWIVEYHGDTLPALRRLDHPGDWYLVRKNGSGGHVRSQDITLVSRLVPAPRQITTRGELNALPEGTVIRAKGELVCERYRHRSKGLVWISTGVDEDFPVDRPALPATVLWTPEVAS